MNEAKRKLTLYPATYQIKVPGKLEENWLDCSAEMTVTVECESYETPVTTLRGTIDQAALQGILRQLYALGLPLISVTWINEE
jgi:hypothetical protein